MIGHSIKPKFAASLSQYKLCFVLRAVFVRSFLIDIYFQGLNAHGKFQFPIAECDLKIKVLFTPPFLQVDILDDLYYREVSDKWKMLFVVILFFVAAYNETIVIFLYLPVFISPTLQGDLGI